MKSLIALIVLILSFVIFSPNVFAACCVSHCSTATTNTCSDGTTPDPRDCSEIKACNSPGCCVGAMTSPFDPNYCTSSINRSCAKGIYSPKACSQIPECNEASMKSSDELKGCCSNGINCLQANSASNCSKGYRFYPKPCGQVPACIEALKSIGNNILVCYAKDKNLILDKFASENTKLSCGEPKKPKKLTMRQIYSKGWKLIQVIPAESVVYYFEKK